MAKQQPSIATQSRNTKNETIDFILVSKSLIPFITTGGMEAFYDGIPTDHRGIFIDLKLGEYLKGCPTAIEGSVARLLRSNHPKQLSKYKCKLWDRLTNQNIFNRVQKLLSIPKGSWTPAHTKEQEAIDRELTEAMLQAEKEACRKRNLPWSPALKKATLVVAYWKIALGGFMNNKDVEPILKRIRPEIADVLTGADGPKTKEYLNGQLRRARRKKRIAILESENLKKAHLEECADAHAKAGRGDKAKILKHPIIHHGQRPT
jgi:hypothetical protein